MTCDTCGKDTLQERPAAWNAKTVTCTNCGAGGHVTPEGEHHGPAFEKLPQTNRGQRGGNA